MKLQKELVKLCESFPDLKINFNYRYWETDFLRFYQSQTNYNISKTSISLDTTIYLGKKSYSFSLYNPTIMQVQEKIEEAAVIVAGLPEDPDFIDLEDQLDKTAELEKTNNIEKVSLEAKTEILGKIAQAVAPFKFKIFGTFICNYGINYVINSNGLCKREYNSPIYFETKAVHNETEVTVLETFGGENFDLFKAEELTARLVEKAKAATNEVVDVDAGEYEVILAPRCIGEYLSYLGSSFSVSSLDQGQSFFEGKLNKVIFPANVTVVDKPNHPEMINFDYNHEGHTYNETPLIEKGEFKNFMVGNYYGRKLKMERNGSTGSAMVMETGDKSLEEMIAGVKNGLYVSSLHYMNFINAKETSLTGLTRDGTFLIEDGKITKVVNNLRFTETISSVINGIIEIENRGYTVPFSENYGEFGITSVHMPHVKVKGFKISSSTHTI